MKFEDAHRTLAKWLNEEIEAPIDRQALAVVLAGMPPPPPVRLTDDEVERIWQFMHGEDGSAPTHHEFYAAAMDAMQAKAQPAPDVAELVEALRETQSNLAILKVDISHALKRDDKWIGVPEIMAKWIAKIEAALAKHGIQS